MLRREGTVGFSGEVAGCGYLRREGIAGAKCFHPGGEAKTWLAADKQPPSWTSKALEEPGRLIPLEELGPLAYHLEQQIGRADRRSGPEARIL
jgi:hypothetical protein